MDKPKLRVDFNELVNDNLVLLSQTDVVVDSVGREICLRNGLELTVFEYNKYQDGTEEYIYAQGTAERNDRNVNGEWTKAATWCCRIDGEGIKHAASEST